jgi:SAM-dependent methyltransferase
MQKFSGGNAIKDFLWLNLRELPYFRALLRAVEARFYQDYQLESPVLDLGCGDGQFATVTFNHLLEVGIDPWTGPVHQARELGGYKLVVQGYGDQLPFEDGYFSSAISNSVLEHIPELDPVLSEMARVIKPEGLFLFCVPNHHFLENLSISTFFDSIGLKGLGDSYRKFFNKISRHCHCDSPDIWENRLNDAGFRIEKWWHYFSPEALHVLEWGHYLGLPSLVFHTLTGHWIAVPKPWNLSITRKLIEKYYREEPNQIKGSYTFYVARRIR